MNVPIYWFFQVFLTEEPMHGYTLLCFFQVGTGRIYAPTEQRVDDSHAIQDWSGEEKHCKLGMHSV